MSPAPKTGTRIPGKLVVSPKSGAVMEAGAHPKNTGGKKGRSGRRPEAFSRFLAKMRQDPRILQALERTLADETSRNYASALKVLTDYDTERPAEKTEAAGKLDVTVRFVHDSRA